jgi:hypothetical protein
MQVGGRAARRQGNEPPGEAQELEPVARPQEPRDGERDDEVGRIDQRERDIEPVDDPRVVHVRLQPLGWRRAEVMGGGAPAHWGFGRERPVMMLPAVHHLRPRRAVCHPCAKTHVLLSAWSVPRHGTEVIIAALPTPPLANGAHDRRAANRSPPRADRARTPAARARTTPRWPAGGSRPRSDGLAGASRAPAPSRRRSALARRRASPRAARFHSSQSSGWEPQRRAPAVVRQQPPGCAEDTIRRSPAATAMESTRLRNRGEALVRCWRS